MGKYFGTDGFRGEANVTLTAAHAFATGRYLGNRFRRGDKKAKILIGRDTRLSGNMLEAALVAGITASGADACLLGVTTTPSVSYLVKEYGCACGVMISASHNPFYDNGIKIIGGDGLKADDDLISGAESYIDEYLSGNDSLPCARGREIGRATEATGYIKKYVEFLLSRFPYRLEGYKVGLDAANGSGSKIAKEVFLSLGCEVYSINDSPNGVNINAGCGSTAIESLRALVKERGLDVGFAYDGDADRCICVDDRAEVVDGDKIMFICGVFKKERAELGGNEVVTTVMSNFGLYKAFEKAGINYAKTAVGDRFVGEYMRAHARSLGGEQSGHIIFADSLPTGDGILTSLKVMEVMVCKKEKLSLLAAPVKIYPQVLLNVKVRDKQEAMSDAGILTAVREAETALGERGRILVRPSGTEQLIRVMVEAEDLAECNRLAQFVADKIKSAYGTN